MSFLAGLTGPVPRTQDQRIFFPEAGSPALDRATPASTRVSSTRRCGCRSRVITGTASVIAVADGFTLADAAHTVPPTGAKGLNLAVADVHVLDLATHQSRALLEMVRRVAPARSTVMAFPSA